MRNARRSSAPAPTINVICSANAAVFTGEWRNHRFFPPSRLAVRLRDLIVFEQVRHQQLTAPLNTRLTNSRTMSRSPASAAPGMHMHGPAGWPRCPFCRASSGRQQSCRQPPAACAAPRRRRGRSPVFVPPDDLHEPSSWAVRSLTSVSYLLVSCTMKRCQAGNLSSLGPSPSPEPRAPSLSPSRARPSDPEPAKEPVNHEPRPGAKHA